MDLLAATPSLTRAILGAPANPDFVLESHKNFTEKRPKKNTKIDKPTKLKLA
jgi:hypothetical protein